MNNLTTLNDNLHDLFKDIKDKNVEPETAKLLMGTAEIIIKSAKAQTDAVRVFTKVGGIPDSIMNKESIQIQDLPKKTPNPLPRIVNTMVKSTKPITVLQDEYAQTLGLNNRLEGIRKFKEAGFQAMFDSYCSKK